MKHIAINEVIGSGKAYCRGCDWEVGNKYYGGNGPKIIPKGELCIKLKGDKIDFFLCKKHAKELMEELSCFVG